MTSERRWSELLFLYRITSSAVRVGVFWRAELLCTLWNRRVRKPHRRGAEWRWDSPWRVKSTTLKTVLLLEKQQMFMYVCIYLSHVNYLTPACVSQNKTHEGCYILQLHPASPNSPVSHRGPLKYALLDDWSDLYEIQKKRQRWQCETSLLSQSLD